MSGNSLFECNDMKEFLVTRFQTNQNHFSFSLGSTLKIRVTLFLRRNHKLNKFMVEGSRGVISRLVKHSLNTSFLLCKFTYRRRQRQQQLTSLAIQCTVSFISAMGTLLSSSSSLSFAPAPAQTSKNEIARKHILSTPIYLELRWRRTLELENLPASGTFTAEFPYLQGPDQGYKSPSASWLLLQRY